MAQGLTHETPVTLAEDVAFRPVGDTGILLNTVSGKIQTCNETARDVVALITKPITAEQMCERLTDNYDVAAKDIVSDVMNLLEELSQTGMIVPAASN